MTAQQAFATHYGVAQYLVAGGDDVDDRRLVNPTTRQIFALAVQYDSGGDFSACEGSVLAPKGTFFFSGEHDLTEVVAPATSDPLSAAHEIGVAATTNSQVYLMLPELFKLAPSSAASVTSCACTRLSDLALPSTLLTRFGITCP